MEISSKMIMASVFYIIFEIAIFILVILAILALIKYLKEK